MSEAHLLSQTSSSAVLGGGRGQSRGSGSRAQCALHVDVELKEEGITVITKRKRTNGVLGLKAAWEWRCRGEGEGKEFTLLQVGSKLEKLHSPEKLSRSIGKISIHRNGGASPQGP